LKQLAEKENELLESIEKLKTDQSRRLRSIQKEIDRTDEMKDEINKLEAKIKGWFDYLISTLSVYIGWLK
jgi:hypothetical protein